MFSRDQSDLARHIGSRDLTSLMYMCVYIYIYIYIYIYMHACMHACARTRARARTHTHTVGTESIQTPLNFSLFVILQPFAEII